MALRTAKEYAEGLRDGRRVHFRGERVPDVTEHPVIGVAVRHAATDFEMAEDPRYRELAVVAGEHGEFSRYFEEPRTGADLRRRSELIAEATARGRTLVPLVKEIGTDALFALLRVAPQVDAAHGTTYTGRVRAFLDRCRDGDLTMSVAQTDVKGDRMLGPSAQPDPDAYLHVVERRPDGIVVRGAKVHTSCTPNVDELIVLPTRAMGPADTDYAVSFAVPIDTPGLVLVASPYGGVGAETFDAPISSRHKMMETVTIFEDVFVPNERVFLAGEAEFSGPLALAFVEYHRFTAVSYKLPLVDALIGAAALLADINGIRKAGHVRDKLVRLISYAETLRALVEAAADRAVMDECGLAVPDPLTTNIAKSHFAHGYHDAVQDVQDMAGALLVTAPSAADFRSSETGDLLRRYLSGRAGHDGEERVRVMNMVSDLTTGDFGGYHAVLAIHAEGSLEAEKLMIARSYRAERAVSYARELAGIAP
ncbi:4-hydroxyphenylacetate 3-hydroxylase N-terminal domain-containing protein [Pseudonocardia sp. TRM90224]|uniref:4-hydroxyphenylacetate 3-hydroxylase N-terminal domain-containing protein n=1 Tax=Pseudonocardia sp. TRM90224 TaxID=2812678 RepID=UPI001E2C3B81|nr:4-hydroxyphenylacetate 3-hydroxylase N-terminal domain-containing protein [Pseudonocardia sp. TRM90224]